MRKYHFNRTLFSTFYIILLITPFLNLNESTIIHFPRKELTNRFDTLSEDIPYEPPEDTTDGPPEDLPDGPPEEISGYFKSGKIPSNKSAKYLFENNISFEISTNVFLNFYIEFDKNVNNRQMSFLINNNEPIYLEIKSKKNINDFNISQPQIPQKLVNNKTFELKYNYNNTIRILANRSIERLTLRFKKVAYYGLDPKKNYTLAVFKEGQESWELITTSEQFNRNTPESYIEASYSNVEGNTEYYFTILEIGKSIERPDQSWIIIIVIVLIVIGILSLAILISKKDYFEFLKRRTTSIDKNFHRLSLEEVLKNDNRNKIIEIILKEPGVHFNELLRKTELAPGNLVWHLDVLETYKVIGKKRVGNYIVYFPYYQKNPFSNIDLKLRKSKLTLKVLELVEKEPGIWNKLITNRLMVNRVTIKYHIDKLIDLGLIFTKKAGRKTKIYPNLESDYFNNSKI